MDQAHDHRQLEGLRILVVEDEALTALQLEDMLESLGCAVVGPAARVQHAIAMLERESVDLALLDLNVAGELVYPVAAALSERNLPFLFTAGLGTTSLQNGYDGHVVLQKPYALAELRDGILSSLTAL
ncbi:response regulator [Methyloligella sp. 2.7D]|uniref:response regulator n=1 Tax=unclassified Methyloligella TaxID=2625955 RepID=UPI00157BBF54|nr:response regulator [Methyloligella sp. GL2]QKP76721.1 response regulator [Methyloligella sp. GL2]